MVEGVNRSHDNAPSVTRRRTGFGVRPSPFNQVKFDLAVILLGAAMLLLVHVRVAVDEASRIGLLFGYGVLGMVWLVLRTRRVLRKSENEHNGA